MLGDDFYEQVQKKRLSLLITCILAIVLVTGITFTFVIPTLKGFEWPFLLIVLAFYFFVANIFVGLFKDGLLFIFIFSLILSALGMGWRIWLEWGEVSLVEHMNPVVLIGYPFIVALLISSMYQLSAKVKSEKEHKRLIS